jgi:cytoskeletal protein CcmA (bactofilin family)
MTEAQQQKSKTILGPDCRISGELALDNDAVIMGQFKGTLRVSGTLELTDSSEVAGTVIAGRLRLAGRAEADVVAEESVELMPGAELTGQVFTSRLHVADGATFQGDVCIGPKAMQAAQDVLNAGHEEADRGSTILASARSLNDAQDADDNGMAPSMPNSLNGVLQRRRPGKMLPPRNGVVQHSNGHS